MNLIFFLNKIFLIKNNFFIKETKKKKFLSIYNIDLHLKNKNNCEKNR